MGPGARRPEPGQVVAGKYRLERELGQGGMGAVFVAVHMSTLRPFAIKLLRPELAGDHEAEARFFREATLASSIHHPAIVDVYDVGRDGDTAYMVMKLLSGQTLRQRIKQGPIAPEEALSLLLPVVEGVAAAHAAGVVHRDLKPDNVLLHAQGGALHPKILDFGISKLLGAEQREKLTKTGITLGTPLYMAPEQMRGETDLDVRVDVYSLGVMLYQMLTGALPYYGKNFAELVIAVMSGGAKPVRALNPAVAPALERIVMRAIANDRGQRQPSVAELHAELQRVRGAAETSDTARTADYPLRDTSTPFTMEARAAWSPPRESRRTRWLALGGVLLLVAGVVGALWSTRGPGADEPHVVTAAAAPPPDLHPAPPAADPPVVAATRAALAPRSPVPTLGTAEQLAPTPSAQPAPESAIAAVPPEVAAAPTPVPAQPPAPTRRPPRKRAPPTELRSDPVPRHASELLDPFQ